MQIQLLIPGLLWPTATLLGPASGLALDGLATLLGRGTRELREFEPYDRQFARLFGLEDAHLPLAALRRLGEADAAATEPGSHWLCADPVNLSFAREHLLLHPFADDALGIDEAATLIKNNPNKRVVLSGWTDFVGSDAYNMKLSQERASSVKNYLVKQGIPSSRMTAIGRGKSFKYDNKTDEGRAMNRRTEVSFE